MLNILTVLAGLLTLLLPLHSQAKPCPTGMHFEKSPNNPIGDCVCNDNKHKLWNLSDSNQFLGGCLSKGMNEVQPPTVSADKLLWLDASDSESIILESLKVSTWQDKSGNNHHATQPVSNNRPAYNNTINNLPVVTFHESNQNRMSIDSFQYCPSSGMELFMVTKQYSGDNAYGVMITSKDHSSIAKGLFTKHKSGKLRSYIGSLLETNQYSFDTAQILGTNYEIVSANNNLYINGELQQVGTIAAEDCNTPNQWILGSNKNQNKHYFEGDIGEILVYDAPLSTTERQAVETYLAIKWGIGLPPAPEEPEGEELLVCNGSFEADILTSGWEVYEDGLTCWETDIGHGIELQQSEKVITANHGNQLVELDSHPDDGGSNSNMYQLLDTADATTIRLEFAYSPRKNTSDETNIIEVYFQDNLIDILQGTVKAWVPQSYVLAIDDTLPTKLEFRASGTQDTYGGLIDNVRMYKVE